MHDDPAILRCQRFRNLGLALDGFDDDVAHVELCPRGLLERDIIPVPAPARAARKRTGVSGVAHRKIDCCICRGY